MNARAGFPYWMTPEEARVREDLPALSAARETLATSERKSYPRPSSRLSPWNADSIETLKRLWLEGCSVDDIAATLGGAFTKTMVIGKAHYLKLPRHAGSNKGVASKKKRAKAAAGPTGPRFWNQADFTVSDLELPEPPGGDAFASQGCRWPLGDPASINRGDGGGGFRFCMRPKTRRVDGTESCWCPEHHALGHSGVTAANTFRRGAKPGPKSSPRFLAEHTDGEAA